jgi:ABC-type spermidine/putrescine transport system permease subunit I
MNLSSPQEIYVSEAQPTAQPAASVRLRRWWRRNGGTLLLLSPLLLFMVGVFAAPMLFQIAFAFFERVLVAGVLWLPKPAFYLGNFAQAFTDPVYRYSIAFTVGVALVTTTANILLALPVAYFLARMKAFGQNLIELSFLLPIFGEIFIIYALAYALTPQGPLNWLLLKLHLIEAPLSIVGNPWIVIVWMSLPTLSVLLIRSAFTNVDLLYEEAAQTMGANPWQTFFRVTVPLAKNGIAGAFLLVFSSGVGAYTIPLVLVGPYNNWLTNKIQREVTPYFNYPMASALGVILTAICALLFYLYLGTQEQRSEQ